MPSFSPSADNGDETTAVVLLNYLRHDCLQRMYRLGHAPQETSARAGNRRVCAIGAADGELLSEEARTS